MAIEGIDEDQFRDVLKRHLTPSRPISSQEYLRGRQAKLRDIDRAFNSEGKHIFIFGDRGVGKTSLARTVAFLHHSSDFPPPFIECEATSTLYQLLRDIATRCLPPEHLIKQETKRGSLRLGLPYLGTEFQKELKLGQIPEIKSMNEALAVISYTASLNRLAPVIVIDEFDTIKDEETRRAFASFLKHISDQEIPIKFIVCGIGDSLDEMIGSHLSTGRVLMPVELERLTHDARWDILNSTADALGVEIDRETYIRIGQISDGFPYYIHLIGEKLLWAVQDDDQLVCRTTAKHFEIGLREAAAEAEPSLKKNYEVATQKYNNDYQEVLWAVADSSSLRRQIKEIYGSYCRIMMEVSRRSPQRVELDQKKFYSRMNSLRHLRHGSIIRTTSAGWYEFRENRLRGYVRLVAERGGIQLEPEHPQAARRFPEFTKQLT